MEARSTARAHFLLLNKDGFKSQSKVVDVIDMNVRISEVTKFKTFISGIASELERRKKFSKYFDRHFYFGGQEAYNLVRPLFLFAQIHKLGNLLFIIAQNISISYISICNIFHIFSIRHFKITKLTFDKAKIIRKLGRLLTIGTYNLHNIIYLDSDK
jgi:hypothetical protein